MSVLTEAKEEMKRAEHLLFVTLKYTRTADVIRNNIKRLINAYDFTIAAILEKLKDKGKIVKVPLTPISRAELLKEKVKRNADMLDYLALYFLMKTIDKAKNYGKREEFRKNVTLIVKREEGDLEVNMVTLKEYFNKTREFLEYGEEKYKL